MIIKEFNKESQTYFSVKCDKKIYSHKSKYQKIEVYHSVFFGNILLLDGCFMACEKNSEGYHLKCLEIIGSRKKIDVCVIGGGDFGIVHHILKNKVSNKIDLIEIDERVVWVAQRYFTNYFKNITKKNVNIIIEDGAEWMKKRIGNKYDVIIIDSTDPNDMSQKLFSRYFFRYVHKNLKAGGIFIQQSGSPILHGKSLIKPIMKKLQQTEFKKIRCHKLSMPIYPLGEWSFIKCMKA